MVFKIDFRPVAKISGQQVRLKIYFWQSFLSREKKGFFSKRPHKKNSIFSLSGPFLRVLMVPEKNWQYTNFKGESSLGEVCKGLLRPLVT